MTTTPKSDPTQNEVLKRALERFQLAAEAEAEIRKDAVEDLKFFAGDQWPEDVKTARELDKRPCLTINRLPQFVRQVTNEQRQNRPAIKVNPVDDKGDVETAEVLQGLIRHIEYSSNAEVAYDTASDGQVRAGFGYFRIITEYCNPMAFEQEIRIKRIRDAFSVYLDPFYTEPDGSDTNWAFVIDTMSKEVYKDTYPNSEAAGIDSWSSIGNSTNRWVTKDEIRVAEYYEKTMIDVTIVKLNDGRIVRKDKIPKEMLAVMEGKAELPEGVNPASIPQIVEERQTQIPQVKWYKINGVEVLEETEIFGSYIPIIPVLGDETFINGKRTLESVIRHAKDPQRMYNYWETAKTEMIALAPKAPFIAAEGSFEGFEAQWQTANVKNHAFLQHKMVVGPGGNVMPAPQRQPYEPPVQAIIGASQNAAADIKATTGIYDAELGNQSRETSGIAITRRVQQSNTSNYHYADNFKRSLRHAGKIILEWIPEVYDAPQAIRVLGADGQQKIVKINEIFMKNGEQTIYDLNKGEYDVTVDTGPSYQTKRQEAVASMLDLTKAVPESMKFALDLLVGSMDWPNHEEVSDRIRKTLPPGLVDDKDDENKKPIPPQVQAQIAQMSQMLEQQHQLLVAADDTIKNKKLELASKERIELQKMQNDLVLEQMRSDAGHAENSFKAEVALIQQRQAEIAKQELALSGPSGGETQAEGPTT